MRGQLAVLLPQPEVDCVLSRDAGLYMFSRTDGIVLGSTNELDDWNLTLVPATTERLIQGHQRIFSSIESMGARRADPALMFAMGGKRTYPLSQRNTTT